MRVKSTREGLIGRRTAIGWDISKYVPFVALPSRAALFDYVRVWNPLPAQDGTIREIIARVLDVGPHHTDDDAYVFGGMRPRAEFDGSNGAGIDLGEFVWQALGMVDNTEVEWEWVIPNGTQKEA